MSKPSIDFDVLLQAYSQKPLQVIEEILRSTYQFTLSLAYVVLQDVEAARVVTQDVYRQAFDTLEDYPTGTNFEAWIAALTLKLSRKGIRSRRLPAVFRWFSRSAPSDKTSVPASTTESSPDSKPAEQEAFNRLADRLRVPVFLYFSQKFTRAETARILKTRETKVDSDTLEGLRTLRVEPLSEGEAAAANADPLPVNAPMQAVWEGRPAPDAEKEIDALLQEFRLLVRATQPKKVWRKHLSEAGWTLVVISLVLTMGWYLSRRVPEVVPPPRRSAAEAPAPDPLERDRTLLFLEADQGGDTSQIAVEPEGSWEAAISADGRWVVFSSSVSNLVPDDRNGVVDIFIFDRETASIERVNLSTTGEEADQNSFQPVVSGDGRYVVYTSSAANLDPRDRESCGDSETNYFCYDLYLRDREANETRMISLTGEGEPVNNISVAPAISADGQWVAYWSMADNLVPNDSEMCGEGNRTYNCGDIFLYSLATGATEFIPIGRSLGENEIPFTKLEFSADGSRLLTTIRRTDRIAVELGLVNSHDIYIFDRAAESWTLANVGQEANPGNAPSQTASLSGDGRYVAFATRASNLIAGDTNGHIDVFLRNLENDYTERISQVRSGAESDGDSGAIQAGLHQNWFIEALEISQDARWVLFVSKASNLSRDMVFDCSSNPALPGESYLFCYHLFLHDRLTRVTQHVFGPIYNYPPYASISGDGRWVVFLADTYACYSRGLCTDVFVYDRQDRSMRALNVGTADASPFIPTADKDPSWAFMEVFRGHRGWVNDLEFLPDGSQLASAALDHSVRMWSIPYGFPTLAMENLENSVYEVASTLDGDGLAAGAMDGDVFFWELPGGRLKGVIEGREGAVIGVEYSPDRQYLAIATPRRVTLYLADTVEQIDQLLFSRGMVTSIDFSWDGRYLAVGSSDRSIWVHRVSDGEVLLRLGSHDREVTSVAFSPDGSYLASGSADRTANVWELVEAPGGELNATLYRTFGHFDWVSALLFSPDGETLITGSYDGALRIWDLSDESPTHEMLFRRPQDQIRSLSITLDGAYLAAGTSGGQIFLWQAAE